MFAPGKFPPRPPFAGQATGGGATYTINALPGSYAISGKSASIIVTRILNAGAGIYAITGASANLIVRRAINAEAGGYAITGSDADLIYTQVTPPVTVPLVRTEEKPGGGYGGRFGQASAARRKREEQELIAIMPVILGLISGENFLPDGSACADESEKKRTIQ